MKLHAAHPEFPARIRVLRDPNCPHWPRPHRCFAGSPGVPYPAPRPFAPNRKATRTLVGDADLAEGRLLQRKFNDPRRDLGRGPVRQDRLLTADLLQRQLAAFVIEFLEAVEAVAAIAEHLAGLAHIAKLPGELQ